MKSGTMEHSAGVIVFRRTKSGPVFALLRKENGERDLPKGHLEKIKTPQGMIEETPRQAAVRETEEEAGFKVEPDPFFKASTEYMFKKDGRLIAKHVDFFLAETDSKSIRTSDEHLGGAEWASLGRAAKKLKHKGQVEMLRRASIYIEKMDRLKALNKEYAQLPSRAATWDLSRRLVPGEGRVDAKVMLIGQAPGDNEDQLLRPFIGRSGQLLDSVLQEAGIERSETYITSIVQFFPPANRLPTEEEVALCLPYLRRQIEIIAPKYVILMGNLAVQSVLGIVGVTENHGNEMEKDAVTYFITFHPAAALRFPERTRPLMVMDFKKFAERMQELDLLKDMP